MEKKGLSNSSRLGFTILGFPDETGVKNVGGRPGTRGGPESFLSVFQKLNGKIPIKDLEHEVRIAKLHHDIEHNHSIACAETRSMIHRGASQWIPMIAVGGGHDYAYPWVKGWKEKLGKVKLGVINIDAHFDLREYRPQMTSGSPFRRLIEESILDPQLLVEFGIQEHCNAPELWKYAKDKKIKTVLWKELRNGKAVLKFKNEFKRLKQRCDVILISFDLDAMSMAVAPGVSSPQAEGLSATEAFEILEFVGADKKVTSLALFELAPALDFHDLTSRFAAQAAWHFLNSKLES